MKKQIFTLIELLVNTASLMGKIITYSSFFGCCPLIVVLQQNILIIRLHYPANIICRFMLILYDI